MTRSVSLVVEGTSDEAVLGRIVTDHGFVLSAVHGRKGKDSIDRKLPAFNEAARHGRWLVVRDLDHDAPCAPRFVKACLPVPTGGMRFRIAIRAVEAWLLADVDGVADYLRVRPSLVPRDPDALEDPKRALVDLANRSSSRAIRDEMVALAGTTARVGPGYGGRIAEFAAAPWSWMRASRNSDSLRRCILRVAEWR